MNGNIDNLSLLIVVFISYEMDWSVSSRRKKMLMKYKRRKRKMFSTINTFLFVF